MMRMKSIHYHGFKLPLYFRIEKCPLHGLQNVNIIHKARKFHLIQYYTNFLVVNKNNQSAQFPPPFFPPLI